MPVRALKRSQGSAIEWTGGVCFTRETGIEKFWRDSKIVGHLVVRSAVLLTIPVHQRAPFMRPHRIFSYKISRESFKKNTLSVFNSGFGTPPGNSHLKFHHKGRVLCQKAQDWKSRPLLPTYRYITFRCNPYGYSFFHQSGPTVRNEPDVSSVGVDDPLQPNRPDSSAVVYQGSPRICWVAWRCVPKSPRCCTWNTIAVFVRNQLVCCLLAALPD